MLHEILNPVVALSHLSLLCFQSELFFSVCDKKQITLVDFLENVNVGVISHYRDK